MLSFDENLNDITQTCEMDTLIRYFNNEEDQVKVHYWNSSFMVHTIHVDLYEHFNKLVKSLDIMKLFQISMDGPVTNWKLYKKIEIFWKKNELPWIKDVGSFGHHSVHGVLNYDIRSEDWVLKKVFKGVY